MCPPTPKRKIDVEKKSEIRERKQIDYIMIPKRYRDSSLNPKQKESSVFEVEPRLTTRIVVEYNFKLQNKSEPLGKNKCGTKPTENSTKEATGEVFPMNPYKEGLEDDVKKQMMHGSMKNAER